MPRASGGTHEDIADRCTRPRAVCSRVAALASAAQPAQADSTPAIARPGRGSEPQRLAQAGGAPGPRSRRREGRRNDERCPAGGGGGKTGPMITVAAASRAPRRRGRGHPAAGPKDSTRRDGRPAPRTASCRHGGSGTKDPPQKPRIRLHEANAASERGARRTARRASRAATARFGGH